MTMPNCTLRAPAEHHRLIRDFAVALRKTPGLDDLLRAVLQEQVNSFHRFAGDAARLISSAGDSDNG